MDSLQRRRMISWKEAGAVAVLLLVPAAAGALGLRLFQPPGAVDDPAVIALAPAGVATDASAGTSGPVLRFFFPAEALFGPPFTSQVIEVDVPAANISPGTTFNLGIRVPGSSGIELVLSNFLPANRSISTSTIFLPSITPASTANWRN